MVSLTTLVCLFFLLPTFLSSLQIHARDSQFFSKVSRTRDDETPIPNLNYYKNLDNEVKPQAQEKEEQQPAFIPQTTQPQAQEKEEQQPTFIPQTTHTGYGLYGHDTGLDAPSTAIANTAKKDADKYENQNNFNDNEKFVDSRVEKKNYVPELTGLSETSYANNNDVGPSNYVAQNNHDNNLNDNNNYEKPEKKQNEKNYVPELTGLGETSYNNNNINHKYNSKNEYIGNDQEEKSYVPELKGLSETSYTNNNVRPRNYNYDNNINHKYNKKNEYIGNDQQEEKSYVPEELDETASYTSNNNYNFNYNNANHKYNKKNEYIGNDQDEQSYVPELGETASYTSNNVGLNKYVAQNNYKYNTKNEYNGNGNGNQEDKSYVPELTGLDETSYPNNVGPNKYIPQNNYIHNYNNNNNRKYNKNDYRMMNDQEEDKSYAPELTGLRETSSYTNKYVPQNKNNNDDRGQGMSDTRYMENGKYFYDMSFDNNYKNGMQKEYKNQFPKEVEEFEFDDQP